MLKRCMRISNSHQLNAEQFLISTSSLTKNPDSRTRPNTNQQPSRDLPQYTTCGRFSDQTKRRPRHRNGANFCIRKRILVGFRPDYSAATSTGEVERIRWSNALRAALEPSPMAMTICLYGTVVQSPAANTPATEVSARSLTTISP